MNGDGVVNVVDLGSLGLRFLVLRDLAVQPTTVSDRVAFQARP